MDFKCQIFNVDFCNPPRVILNCYILNAEQSICFLDLLIFANKNLWLNLLQKKERDLLSE